MPRSLGVYKIYYLLQDVAKIKDLPARKVSYLCKMTRYNHYRISKIEEYKSAVMVV